MSVSSRQTTFGHFGFKKCIHFFIFIFLILLSLGNILSKFLKFCHFLASNFILIKKEYMSVLGMLHSPGLKIDRMFHISNSIKRNSCSSVMPESLQCLSSRQPSFGLFFCQASKSDLQSSKSELSGYRQNHENVVVKRHVFTDPNTN